MQARILATLDDVSSHDFCHSQASALAGSGVDLQTIGKLLRRVNGESTAHYTHLAADRLIAAARPEALTRLELQSALRQAIEQRAFELHYQPIVQLNECNIVGFEALLRWPQPNGDDTAPDIFIPVAEECGLIVPLGTWVLREACRTAARWSIETGGDRTFFISVNVAPNQFQQPNFIDLVRDILMETGAHPRTIAMELTESAAVINPMRTAHMLEELRTMGVRVSLDDFGTGYSSLAHLQAMPFDALKIDGSFVMNQDETNTNWTIVKAMTSMAEAMDLRVVAEGIETEFQRSRLQEIGCKFGQGWLFDRALPEADALALLTSVTTGDGVPQEPHINPQVSKGWVLRSIRGQKLVADYCRGIILANAAVPEGVF